MTTHYQHYRSGQLYGIHYRFDAKGDGIPPHEHDPVLAHNIIVLTGRVQLQVHGDPPRELNAGDVVDFDWTKRHGIFALEAGSSVLHLMLNGMPEGYDRLPESDLRGHINYQGVH